MTTVLIGRQPLCSSGANSFAAPMRSRDAFPNFAVLLIDHFQAIMAPLPSAPRSG
jgi:hypothetical protein